MTNQVDTSPETINAEFDAAEQAIGCEPEIVPLKPVIDPNVEAEREAQITIAAQMMTTTLRLSIGVMANVTVDNKHIDEAAHAYAVLIIKYFPSGIFGLLDKYKEELSAATATFLLIKVVSQAKAEKAKQDAEEHAAKTKKSGIPSATGAFMFGEESGELNNG